MNAAIVTAIYNLQSENARAALATLIATRGSTPRKAGAQMLIYPDGRILGTIGGGCAEAEVRLQALRALDENASFTYKVSMQGEAAANEGMACGGVMEVLIQVV